MTVPAAGLCFIKLLIRDCFLNNSVVVNSINPVTGLVTISEVRLVPEFDEFLIFDSSSNERMARIPCNAANAIPRGACIQFNCSNIIQAVVRQNPDSPTSTQGLCDLSSLATVLSSSPFISGSTTNQQLLIDTSVFFTNDYNDPNIGLYHDSTTPQIALERCFAGNGNRAPMINILAGYAAQFTCFQ